MLDITKLKMGDRVQFSDETFAQVTNYETDISYLKGTVVNFDEPFYATTFTHVWIELDKKHEDFHGDEWGNAVQFNLTDEMDGGTSVDYLKKAKLIKENSNGK